MQVSFIYSGQPSVTLTVGIPKTRTEELPAGRIWQVRSDLLAILKGISVEDKERPDAFASALFIQIKAQKQDITLRSVVFTIAQEGSGETSLCYTSSDLPLPSS